MSEENVLLVPRGGTWGATVAAAAAELGMTPWVLPLIESLPAPSEELTLALERLAAGEYDWLAVTSAAAVPALEGVEIPPGTRVAAVGAATAAALRAADIEVDLIGDGGARELLAGWPAESVGRVLVVRSDLARAVLADGLAEAGWRVDAVVAYRTAATRLSNAEEHALREGKADIALVTSGSVARRLAEVGVPPSTRLVAIGAQTAEDVQAAGLPVATVATAPTVEALLLAAQEVAAS